MPRHSSQPLAARRTAASGSEAAASPPPLPRITRLTPDPRNATRIAVHTSPPPRRLAILHPREVEALGLCPGLPLTADLVERIRRAATLSSARHLALRLLNRRPLSTRDLIARLTSRGSPEGDALSIAADLEAVGLLNDASLARAVVRSVRESRPAGELLLRHKLTARSIGNAAAELAIAESGASRPSEAHAAALKLAQSTLARLSPTLDKPTRARRMLATLSRRGFDEDTAQHAVRAAMGRDFPD